VEHALSVPPAYVPIALQKVPGDILVLGAAGKMGPTLCRMAVRALATAGLEHRVIAASRYSNPAEQEKLEGWGVQTIKGDLLDERFLESLPDCPNVVFMAGMKFGSSGKQSLTWAMNTHLPALVARRFATSRIAAFSTGNVYGLCPLALGGSLETDEPRPVGEYAMSCLGRERMFEHAANAHGTRVSILRLNYACEMRYGVIADLATKVKNGVEIDVSMGAFNAIWQADANGIALASLAHASAPAAVFNIAGPEQLSVRRVCERLGEIVGRPPQFVGQESADAILSNGQKAHSVFGYPIVAAQDLIDAVGRWVAGGGAALGKPTHFETRDGKY